MSDLHAVRERIERSLGELRFGPGAAPVETEASVPEWIGKALWEAQRATLVKGAGHRYVRANKCEVSRLDPAPGKSTPQRHRRRHGCR